MTRACRGPRHPVRRQGDHPDAAAKAEIDRRVLDAAISAVFLHSMKLWLFALFVVGTILIVISGLALSRKVLPILALAGYIVGFVLGYIFQSDDVAGLNDLWIIWTCVYL